MLVTSVPTDANMIVGIMPIGTIRAPDSAAIDCVAPPGKVTIVGYCPSIFIVTGPFDPKKIGLIPIEYP